jgi:hypothetical protein
MRHQRKQEVTPEKHARLEEIEVKAKELRGYSSLDSNSFAQQDMMWLITELKSAWAREAELVKGLENIYADGSHKDIATEFAQEALAHHKASLDK